MSLECECLRFLFPGSFFPDDDEVQWEEATEISEDGEWIFWCKLDCWAVATNTVDCSPSIAVKQITLLPDRPAAPPVVEDDDDVASDDEFWIVLLLHLVTQCLLVFEFPFEYL